MAENICVQPTSTSFGDFWAILPPHIIEILLKYGTEIGNFSELRNIFASYFNQHFLQTTLLKPDVTYHILNLPVTSRQYDALLNNRPYKVPKQRHFSMFDAGGLSRYSVTNLS